MIKRIKPIPFQKENLSFVFLISRGCNREQLFLQFCLNMMSQIDLLRSSIEVHDQLFLLPWWNRNIVLVLMFVEEKPPRCRNVVWNSKASAFLFQTILVFYLARRELKYFTNQMSHSILKKEITIFFLIINFWYNHSFA